MPEKIEINEKNFEFFEVYDIINTIQQSQNLNLKNSNLN